MLDPDAISRLDPGPGLSLTATRRWVVVADTRPFTEAATAPRDPGPPGLWKHDARGGTGGSVFEIPLAAILQRLGVADADQEARADVARTLVRWAADTAGGRHPAGWQPPAAERLDEIIAGASLGVRAGSDVGRARVVATPAGLVMRLAICRYIGRLPAGREAWLQRLLADASRLRMVRLGVGPGQDGDDAGRTVEAQVDLTGAPDCILPAAAVIAAEALAATFSLLVTTATFIGDGRCPSRALAVAPHRFISPKETDT